MIDVEIFVNEYFQMPGNMLLFICFLQTDEISNCHVCTADQRCVQLSSNSSFCVECMYPAIKFFKEMFYI